MKRLLILSIRLWLSLAAASFSIAMVQPAFGAPAVKGDTAAWAEVVAALKKQYAIAFRGKSTETVKILIIEFARPAHNTVFYRVTQT